MKRLISIMVAAFLCCGVQNLSAHPANLSVPSADLASKQVGAIPMPKQIVSAAITALSAGIGKMKDGSGKDACATFINNAQTKHVATDGETVNTCMSALPASIVKKIVSSVCSASCSGKNFLTSGTCNDKETRRTCGLLCCPIKKDSVSNCMSSYSDTCDNYVAGGPDEEKDSVED